jgi:hypothetical protein
MLKVADEDGVKRQTSELNEVSDSLLLFVSDMI